MKLLLGLKIYKSKVLCHHDCNDCTFLSLLPYSRLKLTLLNTNELERTGSMCCQFKKANQSMKGEIILFFTKVKMILKKS